MATSGSRLPITPARRRGPPAWLAGAARWVEARSNVAALVAIGAVLAVAAVLIYRKGLGTMFYLDDWAWFIERREWSLDTLLRPESGHLDAVPLLVYKLLFLTVGLQHYSVYRALLIANHLLCVVLLFALARRRVGAGLALVAAVPVAVLGSGWQNLLLPIQISFLIPIAAGLGAWLSLERDDSVGDVLAAMLLLLGIGSSAVGVAFAVGALVELVAARARALRLWIAAVPLGAFAVWYVTRTEGPVSASATDPLGNLKPELLPNVPAFAADSAGAGLSGLFGVGLEWSRPLLVLALGVAAWRVLHARRVSPRLLSLLAAAGTYLALLGAFRVGRYAASESRYTYLLSFFAILVAAELAVGVRIRRPVLAILAMLAIAAAVGNFKPLRGGSLQLQEWSSIVGAEFGAVDIAGASADPDWVVDPVRLRFVTAGSYLAAVRQLGSPALPPAGISRVDEFHRQVADTILLRGLRVALRAGGVAAGTAPASDPAPPLDPHAQPGDVSVRGPCLVLVPAGSRAQLDATVPSGGVVIESRYAPVLVWLRSFGVNFVQEPVGSLRAGERATLAPPPRPGIVWHMRVSSAGETAICSAGAQ
jgi:hypothetical protein